MATFTANIPDDHVPGITAARETYNSGLPPTIIDPEGGSDIPIPNPDLIETDAEYFDLRAQGMVKSWADQYGYTDEAVIKATEEYLLSLPEENRQEVFDALLTTIDAPPEAVAAMARRLGLRVPTTGRRR